MGLTADFAIVVMTLIVAVVIGPLALEIFFTIADGCGYNLRATRWGLRLSGILAKGSDVGEYCVAAATVVMVGLPIYLHYTEYIPFWRATAHRHYMELFLYHVLPSFWINSNIASNYIMSRDCLACTMPLMLMLMPAGDCFVAVLNADHVEEKHARQSTEKQTNKPHRVCGVCRLPKPPRTHHCSSCKRCIVRMDHHCPFTVGCVGEGNNHFFFMFIFYAWVATVYATWLSLHPYQYCLQTETAAELDATPCNDWTHAKPRLLFLSLASLAIMSAFLFFIMVLRSLDRTIIEFLSFQSANRRRELLDAYRPRGFWINHQRLLGPVQYWWRWLLPLPFLHRAIPPYHPAPPPLAR
ncbi:uncharacterized protein MONBRDRAFT_23154 [Monosiga brevicollis MX1]|uniref:Palmitoyltransferase n=1 Tax=Monosiga brevicollis TaxID=81824 RepID=A9URC3_MONBE|nr:uncharacterized protein MONBRDRAFT_23154 [Monosiga brevicollis MX1]EDQ92218.1 predicted protein [Monosiga brevicollis MX1]|eukprot:XP_001743504.1 hypothetical protein [Monosiga brevicollis MX1]